MILNSHAKIPKIILLACYLGNKNPENTDKKLFKDYKKKSRKMKDNENTTEFISDKEKLNLSRLIALS